MPWSSSAVANLKGTPGTSGLAGRGITSTSMGSDGSLTITFSDASTQNIGVIKGADGRDGTSVRINGSVAAYADLPSGLGSSDAGHGWITEDDGHFHVWDGAAFVDVGVIRGPKGDPGSNGTPGAPGTKIYYGNGTPADGQYPANVGDLYIDGVSGDMLVFA